MAEKRIRAVVGKIDIKNNGFVQLGTGPFTASDLESVRKSNVIIKKVRANVIDNSLWVEDFLDEIIEKALFPGNKRIVFKEAICEDLKFRKKGNIFKSIVKNELVHLNKPDEIIRQIQEIITMRNDFAHGKVIFERRKMFLKTPKGKVIELDESYFNRANDNFKKASRTLSQILRELK
jgi:hypothetical protein